MGEDIAQIGFRPVGADALVEVADAVLVAARQNQSVRVIDLVIQVVLAGFQACNGIDDLERRTRLQQRVDGRVAIRAGPGLVDLFHVLGCISGRVGSQIIWVVGRLGSHRKDVAGLRVGNDHGGLGAIIRQGVERRVLQLVIDGQLNRGALVLLAGEHCRQPVEEQVRALAGQPVIQLGLQLGGAVGQRVVAGQMGIDLRVVVLALVGELPVVGHLGLGNRLAVHEDRPTGQVEFAEQLPAVQRVGRQLAGAEELDVGHRAKADDEQHCHCNPYALDGLVHLALHRLSFLVNS